MPTMRDVAQAAGVSQATVSRVLNASAGVRPETRQRVLAAVRELQFARTPAARRLRKGRTGMVGVVVPDISAAFFADVVKGIENTLSLSDHRLVVCDGQGEPEKEREHCRWLANGTVDALIILAPVMADNAIAELADCGAPLGLFGRSSNHPGVTTVTVDNRLAALRATEHLISHGHREIAFIAGSPGVIDTDQRLEGYREALERRGIGFDPARVAVGHFTEEGGAQALRALVGTVPRPTAVFAANDEMAVGALLAAREMGLQVPQDLAIIGFDNVRLARTVTPGLTTVNQPKLEIGFRLAQNMLERLTGTSGPHRWVLPAELVVRQSCGCGTARDGEPAGGPPSMAR